jgi:hypothetical protein
MSRIPVRSLQGRLAASVALKTKSSSLHLASDRVRHSQHVSHCRLGASSNLARLQPLETCGGSDEDVSAAESVPADLRLPWLDRIEELEAELVTVWQEASFVDLSVLSTFEDAAQDVKVTGDAFQCVRNMMNAGFDAFQSKLARRKQLQLRAIELMEEIRSLRSAHPASEFTADIDPEFDPDCCE